MARMLRRKIATALSALALMAAGCTSFREYVHNDFKVGPNYCRPGAPIAADWIDAADKRVRTQSDDLAGWWTVLNDPLLDSLMEQAYRQNLTVRQAGFRVLAARAQLGFAVGQLFPQDQTATGSFRRIGNGDQFFDSWNVGFNMAWELDFWGRFRRSVASARDILDANVADYDDVLVTLLADVANNYVRYRTDQVRIQLLQNNIAIQEEVIGVINLRLQEGFRQTTTLDSAQAEANLLQSRAALNALQIDLRLAQNQLCILLGMPVVDLTNMLGTGPQAVIPVTPDFVVAGIPADLLRRRPDVRRAERQAAAQAEQIGIAAADFYPAISLSGTLGWQASTFSNLFRPEALNANVGPSFRWNLLNYGRILNNVRFQDAQFRELVAFYQNTVLLADAEAENAIVTFLQSQERARTLGESVEWSRRALEVIVAQYTGGLAVADFNRYATIQQSLITQQDQWAQARGQIALGLIDTYRALGGGWQIRLGPTPDKRGILSDQVFLQQPEAVGAPGPAGDELPAPLPPPGD